MFNGIDRAFDRRKVYRDDELYSDEIASVVMHFRLKAPAVFFYLMQNPLRYISSVFDQVDIAEQDVDVQLEICQAYMALRKSALQLIRFGGTASRELVSRIIDSDDPRFIKGVADAIFQIAHSPGRSAFAPAQTYARPLFTRDLCYYWLFATRENINIAFPIVGRRYVQTRVPSQMITEFVIESNRLIGWDYPETEQMLHLSDFSESLPRSNRNWRTKIGLSAWEHELRKILPPEYWTDDR